MALGDGTGWDETLPSDATSAIQIDDYNRDLRKGIRSRMALEHEWPSSQSATSEGGRHKYITLQEQGVKPSLSGTQKAAVYADTANNLIYEKSDGTLVTIVDTTAVGDGKVLMSATDGSADYLINKLGTGIAVSGTNLVVIAASSDFSTNGFYRVPGGLIHQWGKATGANGETITFPLVFSNSCFAVTINQETSTPNNSNITVNGITKSQFNAYHAGANSIWMAIGN